MGVQSAMVRLLMRGVASTNVMTTNTTQMAVDAHASVVARVASSAGDAATRRPGARTDGWPASDCGRVCTGDGGRCGRLHDHRVLDALLVPLVIAYGVRAAGQFVPRKRRPKRRDDEGYARAVSACPKCATLRTRSYLVSNSGSI